MTRRPHRVEAFLILLFSFIAGCTILFLAVYPLARMIEGKLYQTIDQGARQYQVNGEYLAAGSYSGNVSAGETEDSIIGNNYARLIQQDIKLDAPIYYGDSEECLQKGLGQYENQVFPGDKGILLISGHDSTYLRHIELLTEGQFLTIEVGDNKYFYVITKTAIADKDDLSSYLFDTEEQELILYTCYPIGDVTKDRNQRYIIYGKRYI